MIQLSSFWTWTTITAAVPPACTPFRLDVVPGAGYRHAAGPVLAARIEVLTAVHYRNSTAGSILARGNQGVAAVPRGTVQPSDCVGG